MFFFINEDYLMEHGAYCGQHKGSQGTRCASSASFSQRNVLLDFRKIENQEGINNIDQIIDATDGVMVARWELSFHPAPLSSEMLRTWQFFAQCLCHSLPTGGDMGMEIDIEKVGLVQCFGSLQGMCPEVHRTCN